MILCLAVLVEDRLVSCHRHRETDRQTDRHRPMASTAHAWHRAVKSEMGADWRTCLRAKMQLVVRPTDRVSEEGNKFSGARPF